MASKIEELIRLALQGDENAIAQLEGGAAIPQDFGTVTMSAQADPVGPAGGLEGMGQFQAARDQALNERFEAPTVQHPPSLTSVEERPAERNYRKLAEFRENLPGSFATEGAPEGIDMIEQLHAAGIPYGELPQTSEFAPQSGILPEILADTAASYGQTYFDPGQQFEDAPYELAFNAFDVPGLGALAAGGKAGTKAIDKLSDLKDVAKTGVRVSGRPQPKALRDISKKLVKGNIVGAPPGVKTYRKARAIAKQYADRIERSINAGVVPGYFYEEGSDMTEMLTKGPLERQQYSKINAVMSGNSTPVGNQVKAANKAFEQAAAGMPINTGKSPVEMSKKAEEIMLDPYGTYIGPKTDPYGEAIGGNPSRGVNDQWEMKSMGWKDDAKGNAPSASDTNHEFMDAIREDAMAMLRDRGINLTATEAQELNWAMARHELGGVHKKGPNKGKRIHALPIKGQPAAKTTMQEYIEPNTFQHAWESAPGSRVPGHIPQYADMTPQERMGLHGQVQDTLIDPQGRDILVDAMSGDLALQPPALLNTPGMYTPPGGAPEMNPGTQSRSLVANTYGEMDPASVNRVNATEASRALALGQNAYAGGIPLPPKNLDEANSVVIKMSKPLDEAGMAKLQAAGYNDIIPTEGGAAVLRPSEWTDEGEEIYDKAWASLQEKRAAEIGKALGEDVTITRKKWQGPYTELPWEKGYQPGQGATAKMVEIIDEADMAFRADSPQMRETMGNIARMWDSIPGVTAEQGVLDVLRAWEKDGLEAVREMVRKGLAPAAILTIFAGQDE